MWTDSTIVPHWLKDNGEYKTFLNNMVYKIEGKIFIEWKYVPTKENSADFGSRACEICKLDLGKGPKSLKRSNTMA